MSTSMIYTANTGLDSFNDALSVVSNNVANANTTAYKSQTVDFGDLVAGYISTADGDTTAQGVGSAILDTSSDQNTGTENQTGLWSDLMIQGAGYFTVQSSSGVDYYTRDGSFEINSSGYLTDTNGDQVLDSSGKPIEVESNTSDPTYSSYSVDQYGNLVGTESNGSQATIDQIGVTTFSNPNGLISEGNNMFTKATGAGQPVEGTAGVGQAGTIISGTLEGSNVNLTQQMVNLINYQAAYQANSKSVVNGDSMLQTAVDLIT